jgi:hypothetical protein
MTHQRTDRSSRASRKQADAERKDLDLLLKTADLAKLRRPDSAEKRRVNTERAASPGNTMQAWRIAHAGAISRRPKRDRYSAETVAG